MKVLVVEDQEVDARVAARIIAAAYPEAEIDFAGEAAEAEAKLHDDLFDLVVVDLELPDEAGPSTVQRMREAGRELTIVVLTGDATNETLERSMANGADDYVVKGSMTPDALATRLRLATLRHADYLRRWFADDPVRDAAWVHAVLNDIAHELRTPLTSLRASAVALRQDADNEVHQRMVRNVQRISEAVDSLYTGVKDHVLLERLSLQETFTELMEHGGCSARLQTLDDIIVIGQRSSLQRALRMIVRIVAMEHGPPNLAWRGGDDSVATVTISTEAGDVFAQHPVMKVLIDEQLATSMAKLQSRPSGGLEIRLPMERHVRPTHMEAAHASQHSQVTSEAG